MSEQQRREFLRQRSRIVRQYTDELISYTEMQTRIIRLNREWGMPS